MIDFIIGKIEHKGSDYIVINSNNIGYKVWTSVFTLMELDIGENSKLYTDMVVREDGINLYGFLSLSERDIYKLLTTVKGIGPKVAIGILSGMDSQNLASAIKTSNITYLTQAPGVGKKTAERIILELKDKFDHIEVSNSLQVNSVIGDAEEALLQLGYSSYEIKSVLEEIYDKTMNVEDLIKYALKEMMR